MGMRNKFIVIAGPCVIENEQDCIDIALEMKSLCEDYGYQYIFKSSYEKANRTAPDSFEGYGMEIAHRVFATLKSRGIITTTDFHTTQQAAELRKVIDVAQIPAFLCRQTKLIEACAHHYQFVNIKKGQMVSPEQMECAVQKVYGVDETCTAYLTERGSFFGYNDLVVDMRSIDKMRFYADRVIFDATHSCQKPGHTVTSGSPRFSGVLTRAALAAGCTGLFIEVHKNPKEALSDASTQLPLSDIGTFFYDNVKNYAQGAIDYNVT